jgi:hypothetical protein
LNEIERNYQRLGIHNEFNEIERKAWYTQWIQWNREKGLVYTMNSMK